MRVDVDVSELEVNSVDDLYLNVLVPAGRDPYDGRTLYDVVSVWYCLDDIDEFESWMKEMGVEEFTYFRDETGSNVLSSLALSDKPIEFWDLVENFVGHEEFVRMLTMDNRTGCCPITQIRNVDVFAEQLDKTLITSDMMRQIAIHGTNEIVEYVTDIVNLFNPSEFE